MKTTRVYSVPVDVEDGTGPDGGSVRTFRFTSQCEAEDFMAGKTLYGHDVTGMTVENVPAALARRWVMEGKL